MATAMVQMNTRIEADTKAAGDKALRDAGFTPSAAIRALWRKAARGGKDLQEIVDLLNGPASSSSHDAAPASSLGRVAPLARGRKLVPAFFAELGIAPEAPSENAPTPTQATSAMPFDKEIEAALVERYKERGLL